MSQTPKISVDGRQNRIRIHKTTLYALGRPDCIVFLVNPDRRVLAVASSSDVNRAYRIHWERMRPSFDVSSLSLVDEIYNLCPSWEKRYTYRIAGDLIEEEDMVVFLLDHAVPVAGA